MGLFIHPKVYFFCLLIAPALLVRVLIFHRKSIVKNAWMKRLVTFCGSLQDAFLAWQAILLVLVLKACLPFAFPFLFWVLGLGYFLIQLDVVFDAFLFYKTSMRFDVSFYKFIDDIKCFWDSAKARGIGIFIAISFSLLTINLLTMSFLQSHMWAFVFSKAFLWMGFGLGIISLSAHLFLPRRIAYTTTNTLLMQELWLIQKSVSLLMSSLHLSKKFVMPNKALFFSQEEDFSLLTPEYPILKFTHGFSGQKNFKAEIENGKQPHVIFLFMESWRAKDVGSLGGPYPITPHFDALAEKGVLFKNFYSNSIKTSRAVTASLFGIPSDVQTIDASSMPSFPLISIADVLKRTGYTCNYFLGSHLSFENQRENLRSHGFDNLAGTEEIKEMFADASGTSWGVHDEYLMRYAADHLEANAASPQFLTMFTISNHHPWIYPHGPHSRLALPAFDDPHYGKYLRSFHYSDACIGQLISALEEKNLIDNTLLFIMGDHGQPMGEHGQSIVGQFGLYEENIHVPCLIYAPGFIKEPKIVHQIGSQLDLFPTVMDMLNIKGLNHTIGTSLMRKTHAKKIFFHNPYVYNYFGCRYDNYKLVYTRNTKDVELYDLAKDPNERENLKNKYPELVKELLGDVHCYETFFKRLYRKRLYRPQTLDIIETEDFTQA